MNDRDLVRALNRKDVRALATKKAETASDELHYGVAPYVACGFATRSTMNRALVTCATCLAGIAANDASKR
jgi:hypothetical protein